MKHLRNKLYFVGLVLGGSLLLYQVVTGYQALRTNSLTFQSILFFGVGVLLGIISCFFQMASWLTLMRGLGVILTWKEVTRGYFLSFLPRYIPGTVWGYLSRGEWLLRSHNIPFATTHIGSLLEIVIAMITGVVIIGLSTLLVPGKPGGHFLTILAIFLPLILWVVFNRVSTWSRYKSILPQFLPFSQLKHLSVRLWSTSTTLYTIQWLIYGGIVYCLYQMVQPSLEHFSLIRPLQFSASFSLAWIIGFIIIFFPAGLGLRELVLTYILSTAYPISFSEASLISVASRLLISLAEMALILVSLIVKQEKTSQNPPIIQDNPKGLL